jgi:hypothetical protein
MLERHGHSWLSDSFVVAQGITGLLLSTQGLGKRKFQEFEEIRLSCRKISRPLSEAP